MPNWLRVMAAALAMERADQNGSLPRACLVRAGALIIAEIAQLDRQERLMRDRITFDAYRVDLSEKMLIVFERKGHGTAHHRGVPRRLGFRVECRSRQRSSAIEMRRISLPEPHDLIPFPHQNDLTMYGKDVMDFTSSGLRLM
jgi:hypothetical protein